MAYQSDYGDDGKDPVYDLRQVYAVELVGEALKDIARARKSNNFAFYYECLNDLYVIVKHKFKEKKNAVEEYERLIKNAVDVANKHPNEWLGKTKDPKGCINIKMILNEIEMFLYEQMEKSNMFGSNKYIAGL